MKNWFTGLAIIFLFHPIGLTPDDDAGIVELQDFDDDAFLSAKTHEPSSFPKESSGNLISYSLFRSENDEDKYIINFHNVSILEYLNFISKISKINFQFEEQDMDFTVTVIADDPLSIPNILSALIQTLRARGFLVLEQDNNLLLTKSRAINQIPTIVSPEKSGQNAENAPIVTRIFRIQNANLNSVASIIRPMMSQGSMVDVSNETRQLIVTDITTNVDKIATLLRSLDSPHSPLDIEIYKTRYLSPDQLIPMTKQIVDPFSEGNPLIFVPQNETNTIFVVSTPHLIERSVTVMEDLDVEPQEIRGPIGSKIFLYKVERKPADELLKSLKQISKELQGTGSQSMKLVAALETAKWIKESNSILFITDSDTQDKIEAILKTLDTSSEVRNYYIYKIQRAEREQIERTLDQLAKTLKKNISDQDLVDAIQTIRYLKDTNSFIFTGTDNALKKLAELLPTFDLGVSEYSPSSHYWLYTPQFLSGTEIEDALNSIEKNLQSSGLTNEGLLNTIQSMKWVPSTNTLLFTGDPTSLDHVQAIIKLIDVASGAPTKIFIYQPKYISQDQIENSLDELADKLDPKNLSDRNLASAIDNMTWIAESQTFLFKADPSTIDKINDFLKDLDSPKEAETIANSYFLYKLKYARGEEVLAHLQKIAKSLPSKDPVQKAIVGVINGISFLKETNAILLTGPQKAVEDVKFLIDQFDIPGTTPASFEKTSFFIYKPINVSPNALEIALKDTAADLRQSGLIDPSLLQSIDTMRLVESTNSIVFTGTRESLDKTKEIISTIDLPGVTIVETQPTEEVIPQAPAVDLGENTFLIYKVRYVPIKELMSSLLEVARNLERERTPLSRAISTSIKNAKEVRETNSLLFTGPALALEKITELLKHFDTPIPEGTIKRVEEAGKVAQELMKGPSVYVIYKPIHVKGPELIEILRDFEQNLAQSGVQDQGLFDTINHLKFIEKTGFILISGDQKSVEKVDDLLRKFDFPLVGAVTAVPKLETNFLIYKLQYHSGDEIQKTLKQIGQDLATSEPQTTKTLLHAINSIQWIKITNSLLATGNPEILTQLKELVQNIDVPLRQVFIEVLIIRTTITNQQQFGLQWGGKVQYLNRFAGGTSNFPAPSAVTGSANTALAPALATVNNTTFPVATDIPNPSIGAANGLSLPGGFDLGVIGDIILHKGKSFISLASLVNALQSDDQSVVVMNPKIIGQDNQQATIFVGQNIPFTGSNVSTVQGGGSQVQSNVEYRDVGTNLTITPYLGTNDIVTLDISNEITEQVANTTAAAGSTLQGLQTSRTSLNTRVHVPSKHFVALSGLINETKTHFKSGIPCLGGLPVIGAIFSENDRLNSRDNVIFFLRPVIIDSIEEYERITQNQECLYKERSVKQILKEEFDDGIDIVKYPDFECY